MAIPPAARPGETIDFAPRMTENIEHIVHEICERSTAFASSYKSCLHTLKTFENEDSLLATDLVGKHVLDWECGEGAYAAKFLELGAASVTAIDTWLNLEHAKNSLSLLPRSRFERVSIERFIEDPGNVGAYDLVFSNTVTEHMLNLPRALTECYQLVSKNGLLIINHDNYYQPVGSHDHGFLFYNEKGQIVFQGSRCWESVAKCAASADYRRSMSERFPWTWDSRMESRLTPEDCDQCPYYRRAQPWAHLLYQNKFREVFPQPAFTTGYPQSLLNKVTPFQLRQFVIEAGFDVVRWREHRVSNQPPAALLNPPYRFSVDDLCTCTITVRCRKGQLPSELRR